MSEKKFMVFDLVFLFILALLSEVIGYGAIQKMFNTGFVLSLSMAIVMIAIIRWNHYGIIMSFVVGIITFIVLGFDKIDTLIIYAVGNLGISLSLIWFKFVDKDEIRSEWLSVALFFLTGFIGVITLRSFISMLFGLNFFQSFKIFLVGGEAFNFVIGLIILTIAAKQEDTLKDMKLYLKNYKKKDVVVDEFVKYE